MQLADSELQLDATSEEMTVCPMIYWTEHGAQFVVCKVAADRYRCQFFNSEADHNMVPDMTYTTASATVS